MTKKRLRTLFSSFQLLYGKYQLQIVTLVAVGFLSGIFGALGITTLIPIFSFLSGTSSTDSNIFSKAFEAVLERFDVAFSIPAMLVVLVVFFILQAVALYIFQYIGLRITADYEAETRIDLYRASLHSEWRHLLKQKIGHVELMLTTHIRAVVALLSDITSVILTGANMIVYGAVALTISPSITFGAFGAGVVILLLFLPIFYKMRVYAAQREQVQKRIAHEINENVLGLKIIKAMHIAERASRAAVNFFDEFRWIKVRAGILRALTKVSIQPLGIIFIIVLFALSYRSPDFNIGTFAVVVYLVHQIFLYIDKGQTALHTINSRIPYVQQVIQFRRAIEKHKEADIGHAPFLFSKELTVRNATFAYGDGAILNGINFTIRKGAMVGIIGPSGVGKTTLVDLLLRLFELDAGAIFLDGVPINDISLREWRRNIGYVSQDIFLKNDTIEQNIKFYDDSITDDDMRRAARAAHIEDVIDAMPRGFSTVVGDRGILLSAGQRQRIILARVLARRPKILLLDEATSALDNESETYIKKAIDALKGDVTIIVIAHRLSTIMNCDYLIALENGRIVEEGIPDVLLKDKKSYFYKMYNIR